MSHHWGWYARRRVVLDHLEARTITLIDSGIHDYLCLIADYKTGEGRPSAEKIHVLAGAGISLRAIQRSLNKMEKLGWLKRFMTPGKKGNYYIVICRYFVRDASGTWQSVNLERTTDWRAVQFDPVTDPSFLSDGSVTRRDTEVSPVQEGRTPEPKKEDEPASAFFSKTKNKIAQIYQRRFKHKITWQEAETKALELILQDHSPENIVRAYGRYLETGDDWEKQRGFPFCSFSKKASQYLVAEADDDDEGPYYPPSYIPPPPKKAPTQ